jgi:hypothetical protein
MSPFGEGTLMETLMTDAHQRDFGKRLDKIHRRHAKLSNGYVTSVNHDGLIIAVPRRRMGFFPWRGLGFALILVMAVKVLMYWQMGPAAYEANLAALQSGATFEQVAAYVLYPDQLTIRAAEYIVGLEAR